ncbi:MAG: lysophospholipid acyltransferase family protein [bacterium]
MKIKKAFLNFFSPYLGNFLIRSIGKTLNLKIIGFSKIEKIKKNHGKIIYAFWHGEQFPLAYFFKDKNICLITSLSEDGNYQTKIIKKLGYQVVRGDNKKGGVKGLLSLIEKINEGFDIALAIDGPVGPIYEPKPGVIYLAKKTGQPIIPISIKIEKSKIFEKAWDKYILPKPFSKGIIFIGDPIFIDKNEKNIEEKRIELKNILLKLKNN